MSARSARVLLFCIAALAVVLPANASAHSDGNSDGRIPGQPDFKRVGESTYHYIPTRKEYKISRPDEPPAFLHWHSELRSTEAAESVASGEVAGSFVPLPTQELAPICRTAGNRIVVVYEGPDPVPFETLRSVVRRMNWKIADQSSQSSGGARVVRMAVDCDSQGNISVYRPVSGMMGPFGTPKGGDAVKYLSFGTNGCGAAAELHFDSTKSRENQNATLTARASAGNCEGDGWGKHSMMHELFHTLGAVQTDAPHYQGVSGTSTAGHCDDNYDVMCYPSSYFPCPESGGFLTPIGVPLDCGTDTYFDAAPAPGSYLDTHWNSAGPEDPFLTVMPTQAPTATTTVAASLKSGSATLQGTVTPQSEYAFYQFEYGKTTSYGAITSKHGVLGQGSTQAPVSLEVDGLIPNTTYHYRTVATNDAGAVAYGTDQTFTTTREPVVIAGEATDIVASDATGGSAVLHGTINPGGSSTTYQFQWSPLNVNPPFQNSVPITPKNIGSGSEYLPVSEQLTGLKGQTTYRYRLVATNPYGTVIGEAKSFTTPSWKPAVSGAPSAKLDPTAEPKVTLTAFVNPNGLSTSCYFDYGTSYSYGTKVPAGGKNLGSGNSAVEFSEHIEPLTPDTNYYYQVVCTNADGTIADGAPSFATPKPPPVKVTTGAATGVTAIKATLIAAVATGGFPASYSFEYGKTSAYGMKTSLGQIGWDAATNEVSQAIEGLQPGTVYHYRVQAVGKYDASQEVVSGGDQTVKTDPSPLAVTGAATNVEFTKATLTGIVNPESLATTYQFEYGPTASYGTKVPASPLSAGSGIADVPVGQPIEGLSAHSTYHFRLVATNSNGTTLGADREFFTGSWTSQTTPNPVPYDQSQLEDTSCLSATACIAVGNDEYQGTGFIQYWDGTNWTTLETLGNSRLSGVSCSGEACLITGLTRVTGVGTTWKLPKILSGKAWGTANQLTTPTPAGVSIVTLEDVSCSAETACTAVGNYYNESLSTRVPLAMRWNGSAWTIQTTPNPSGGEGADGRLLSVSCPSSTSCTAVGTRSSSGIQTFSERWNGTSWSIASVPKPAGSTEGELEDVSCATTSACMAVGWFKEGSNPRKGLAESWSGSAWSTVATPAPSGAENGVTLSGISCTAASACTAAGRTGGVGIVKAESTLAEVWNGSAWSIQTTTNPLSYSRLSAVSCTSASACTAVGRKRPESKNAGTLTLAERWG